MHLRLSTDFCFTDFELTVRHSGCMMFSERRHTVMNTSRTLMKKQNSDEAALKKYTMILPLLDENLDPASAHELRISIAEKNDISERTVRRYVSTYREKGFDGLKPAERTYYSKDNKPENYDELLEDAIQLRREVPRRSVEQIILILESEGKVAPGVLKRSTMQRHLFNAGFGASHMDVYSDARKSSSKRFCKPHRMMLIQGDIKYGPNLPSGKTGPWCRHIFHLPLTTTRDLYLLLSFMIIRKNA